MDKKLRFYEFFAGGGMARAGLGAGWHCLFANDAAPVKIEAYKAKWGSEHLSTVPIEELQLRDVPCVADLAWASFPCQDVSIAGNGLGIGEAGVQSTRSGALWPFLDLIAGLRTERRHPSVVVLENVTGLLTSNFGRDFQSICCALQELGYVFGAVIVDAKHFLPQSRPRIFIVAASNDVQLADGLTTGAPLLPWHTPGVVRAHGELADKLRAEWRWWRLGNPPTIAEDALVAAIDLGPNAAWHTAAETNRLLSMMTPAHAARLENAKKEGAIRIGSLYLRMRPKGDGNVQRAEIAFGPTLGCLRTPRGGGSRPRIIVVNGEEVRTRLLSASEAARLMGLAPDYPLPQSYEHAFQLIGDGVAAPTVRFLAETLIEPLARAGRTRPQQHTEPTVVEAIVTAGKARTRRRQR